MAVGVIINDPTNTFATVGITSSLVLAANEERMYACLINDSATAAIYLSLGGAAVVGSGIALERKGSGYEILPENLYRGDIYAISTEAGANLSICEGDRVN